MDVPAQDDSIQMISVPSVTFQSGLVLHVMFREHFVVSSSSHRGFRMQPLRLVSSQSCLTQYFWYERRKDNTYRTIILFEARLQYRQHQYHALRIWQPTILHDPGKDEAD